MCGIAGFVSERPAPPGLVRRMCDRIVHRGPDGSGYYERGPVALGHRRLSIIDLSGGAQPLGNEDASIQIVFNGEIYNYLDLRRELIEKGHRFQTNSDTEVLVHLYEDVGERLPEYLNGMFAFAIWDDRNQSLFLARDRFGKKPLYYSTAVPGYRICFASELKALHEVRGLPTEVDPTSVADYFALAYIPDPKTIYRGVRKLEPACSLLVTSAGAKLRRYWEPAFNIDERMDYREALRECLDLTADSVNRRMISDVPLGGFLSGGVDSSAVVALMSQRASQRVKTFSIGFTSEEFDEVNFARLVAKRYETDHRERVVTPSIEEMLPVVTEQYDEPFADSSAIPTLYLSRMTREHVTVALSGDGGDEVFGGYRRYHFGVVEDELRSRIPGAFRRSVVRKASQWYPKFDYLPRFLRAKATLEGLSLDLGHAYFASMSLFRFGLAEQIMAPEFKRALAGYSPADNFAERFRKYSHLPALQQMEAVDFETYLPGDILVKVDRASMAYSLEARCPLLDYRLADLACRMPASFKLRGGIGKFILKDMVRPYVPAEIIDRPKQGFSVPLQDWFCTSLKPVFERVVLREEMERYVSLGKVGEMWRTHLARRRNYARELWSLLMLGCWEERYGSGKPGVLAETLAEPVRGA